MKVREILLRKGEEVKAAKKSETLEALAQRMRREGVGALVVRTEGGDVAGVVAERDIVRAVADYGIKALALTAEYIMRPGTLCCAPDDSLRQVSRIMTEHKVRHLPVVWDKRLVGIVSIGDVVKHRIDEVELESSVLRDLAATAPRPVA